MSTPLSDLEHIEIMEQIAALLLRQLEGSLTEEEAITLQAWLDQQSADAREFYAGITTQERIAASLNNMYQIDEAAALDDVWNRMGVTVESTVTPVRFLWKRWVAAAAVISAIVTTSVLIFSHKQNKNPETPMAARYGGDALPGGDKATLQLADGSVIVLDSAHNGALALQGNTNIIKNDSGTISYQATGNVASEIAYNKINTPRGGQFKLVLPDGTKVWLNAASSLRYPAVFAGNDRTVELSGEAYFEVAPDASKRFNVTVAVADHAPMKIEVLGTSFDIQAYADEPIHEATLLSGKIRVGREAESVLLHPGQQAQLSTRKPTITTTSANEEDVLAWKNGLFSLQDATIQEIMRQVSRWYDVEVVYEGDITTQQFIGKIPRNTNLSDVLTILESTGWVHFKLEGNKLIVRP
ncbi:FecR family protein [Chitinophaga sp. Cy-1792]|uniref:FecR family protein n=1 Tax=Chitinophaga sp. Cy-1792 TaxID=2608339 RepID=UPI0014249F2F|nr:FecR family protein [Chitinophaga sp. Cy-1792]NIG53561.1 FecR family protein [Chitinophaga sp. Cy-1792]